MSIYAVNGKVPVSAWIPTRDTVGNGTSVLRDLVGSNDGSLIGMDPATDWVTDTSNGGAWALDFDGDNDLVRSSRNPSYPFTIAGWFKASSLHLGYLFGFFAGGSNEPHLGAIVQSNGTIALVAEGAAGQVTLSSSATYSANQWVHVVAVFTSSVSRTLYVNGVSQGTSTANVSIDGGLNRFSLGLFDRPTSAIPFSGRLDDVRVFSTALDASDVSYLYNGGNGRGRAAVVITPNTVQVSNLDLEVLGVNSPPNTLNLTSFDMEVLGDISSQNDLRLSNLDVEVYGDTSDPNVLQLSNLDVEVWGDTTTPLSTYKPRAQSQSMVGIGVI